uniref:Uncharacterized protein n=1 Tax=Callorhinchus milii TaxID=7868 RepID=A0A4W3GFK8_CALMI
TSSRHLKRSRLQPLWENLRLHHEDNLRSPLFPVINSAPAYLLLCAAFMLFDLSALRLPFINRYKIQPPPPHPPCTILFDLQYYVWHWPHHWILWALHHEIWTTQHLSNWELITGGFWCALDLLLLLLLRRHCLTDRLGVHALQCLHLGGQSLRLRFLLVPPQPGAAGTHNPYHQKPTTNFAPFFTHPQRVQALASRAGG